MARAQSDLFAVPQFDDFLAAQPDQPQNWLAVVSAEHVRRGRAGGFMQACHGKAAPLKRMKPGDGVVYYSPTITFGGKDRYQHFTAIGRVRDERTYPFDMGGGFVPHRRDVVWAEANEAPIQPLLGQLDMTREANWGYQLRFGLIKLSARDYALIGQAMGAAIP